MRSGATAVESLTQAADMDIDGPRFEIDVAAPGPVEQLFAAEDMTRLLHQDPQQAKLRRPQMHALVGAHHLVRADVHRNAAIFDHLVLAHRVGAAQDRADAPATRSARKV